MIGKRTIDEGLVARLVKLLEDHGLTELEYGEGRWRIRVSRASPAAAPASAGPARETTAAPAAAAEATRSHPGAVTSPMVGTVYAAPEPGAEPFVKVGDTVSQGQTLLLIEAMKTMNPIRAPRPGKVTQILVVNGAPVEYGEVLLIIE